MRRVGRHAVNLLIGFLHDLSRRRVIRVGAAYLVGAWVLIEAVAVVFPAIGLPDAGVTVVVILVAACLPVALVLSWYFDISPDGIVLTDAVPDSVRDDGAGGIPATSAPEKGSLAVLAFVDKSPDGSQEYLADGISEELTNILGKIDGLRIVARSSAFAFKGRSSDVRDIGRKLNVASVLDGSVRRSGDQLRISAELIDISTGYSHWMNAYDRHVDEMFTIQDDIARSIARELRPALGGASRAPEKLVEPGTQDQEAYTLYLKGRFYWNSRYAVGLERAIEYFNDAIAADADFALPWSGLADAYNLLAFYNYVPPKAGFSQALDFAERAVSLGPDLSETHASLAFIRAFHEWNFKAAETGYRKALEKNPQYGPARFWFSFLLAALGRSHEAIEQIQSARKAEPFSAIINSGAAYLDYFLRRHDIGMQTARDVLRADPNFGPAYMFLGFHSVAVSHPGEAVEQWRKAVERQDRLLLARLMLAVALARAGDSDSARETQAAVEAIKDGYASPYYVAAVHLALGERNVALENLERALAERNNFLTFVGMDPIFEQLHEEPRFLQILEAVGVPLQRTPLAQRTG